MTTESKLRHVMQLWQLAINSGYAKPETWSDYAGKIIVAMDDPPFWVIELACSKDVDTAGDKLGKIYRDMELPDDFCDQSQVFLGYRFKLLQEGRISTQAFYEDDVFYHDIDAVMDQQFPDVSDSYSAQLEGDTEKTMLDVFYELGHTDEELREQFETFFGPWRETAMAQYDYLVNCSIDDVIAGRAIPRR